MTKISIKNILIACFIFKLSSSLCDWPMTPFILHKKKKVHKAAEERPNQKTFLFLRLPFLSKHEVDSRYNLYSLYVAQLICSLQQ